MFAYALIELERKVSNYADNLLGWNCSFNHHDRRNDMGLIHRDPPKMSTWDLR